MRAVNELLIFKKCHKLKTFVKTYSQNRTLDACTHVVSTVKITFMCKPMWKIYYGTTKSTMMLCMCCYDHLQPLLTIGKMLHIIYNWTSSSLTFNEQMCTLLKTTRHQHSSNMALLFAITPSSIPNEQKNETARYISAWHNATFYHKYFRKIYQLAACYNFCMA
jgi:hypothetical protein